MMKLISFFTGMISLLLIASIVPAFSQEAYKFDLMWPQNTQPWYFNWPQDVTADSSGNVYVADTMNDCIQKFDSNGNFMTKWGTRGTGDGQFDSPAGIAVALDGSVYVADRSNCRIQKFDSNGNFVTKWGSKGNGEGMFDEPVEVAIDSSGNVYIVDTNFPFSANHRIQKFDSQGKFLTQWGSFGSGDGQFGWPSDVSVDLLGNVFVVDPDSVDPFNSRIQKFDSKGTFIGKWSLKGWDIRKIAIDPSGNAYVSAFGDQQRILRLDPNGNLIDQWEIEGGMAGITVDLSGNIYVTEDRGIQKFTPSGKLLDRWCLSGKRDGQFDFPQGIAIGSRGDIYVADTFNNRIQKFDSNGNFIAKWGTEGDGQFQSPSGIATDASGNVYVIDEDSRVQKFDKEGVLLDKWYFPFDWNGTRGIAVDSDGNFLLTRAYEVCWFTGCPPEGQASIQKFDSSGNLVLKWGSYGTGDGQFRSPSGIAIDASGNVYVADTFNNRIQKFDSNGNFITRWGSEGTGEGQFQWPAGVSVDMGGNVYVADSVNNRIYKFDSNGNFTTTWGFNGIGEGQFYDPTGIVVASSGIVYVADTWNHRIQKFSPTGQETISAPNTPPGPIHGVPGVSYTYSTGGSVSSHGHPLEYRFDWGDGTYSDWSLTSAASKTWSLPGDYQVKAQARCATDISVVSYWSPARSVTVGITLLSPLEHAQFDACSLYSPVTFSWNASDSFVSYEIHFFGMTSIPIEVPASSTEIVIPSDTWRQIMMSSGTSGTGTIYWSVIGTRSDATTETSNGRQFLIVSQPPGNPTISPTGKRSKPTLTWQTICNTKFKVWFGSDSSFTKRTFSFEIENPNENGGTFSKTLTARQWLRIKNLVKNKSGSTIYWYVESWDGLGRYAKTDVMNFVLTD